MNEPRRNVFELAEEVRDLPTIVDPAVTGATTRVHESVLRSHRALIEVERMLREHTTPSAVLDFIAAVNRKQTTGDGTAGRHP